MKNIAVYYTQRIFLSLLLFITVLILSHQLVEYSVDAIILFSQSLTDDVHIWLLFFIPIYLAVITFGLGVLSVYAATKIHKVILKCSRKSFKYQH
jgi:hypothetical protein